MDKSKVPRFLWPTVYKLLERYVTVCQSFRCTIGRVETPGTSP